MMKLKEKPENAEGCGSYNEIHRQVENEAGKKINKKTLYHICHCKLNAVSRVPGHYNPEHNKEDIRNFREKFSDNIKKEIRKEGKQEFLFRMRAGSGLYPYVGVG